MTFRRYDLAKIALHEAQAALVVAEARAERLQESSEKSDTTHLRTEVNRLKEALSTSESNLKSRTEELERLKRGLMTEGRPIHSKPPAQSAEESNKSSRDVSHDGNSHGSDGGQASSDSEDVIAPSESPPENHIQGLQVLLETERGTRVKLERELALATETMKSLKTELQELESRHSSEIQRVRELCRPRRTLCADKRLTSHHR